MVFKILTKKFDVLINIYLDDIFIYIEDAKQAYINVIC